MDCPRKVRMRGAIAEESHTPDDIFVPSCKELRSNSAKLKKILCNSSVTVPLQLLAIEEDVECDRTVCAVDKSNHSGLLCNISHTRFVHLYITTEYNSSAFIRHCIIAFVEGAKIGKYDELIELLYRTISWLKIEDQRPHFYIYYYGKQPVFETNLNEARINITRALRSRLKNYETGESFCNTWKVRDDAVNFTIYDSNPYQFKVS